MKGMRPKEKPRSIATINRGRSFDRDWMRSEAVARMVGVLEMGRHQAPGERNETALA